MKYTITRALAELKVLRQRHEGKVSELKAIAVKHGNKLRSPYSSYREEDFKAQSVSSVQSIEDLQKRIIEIKNAIDASNFTTKVIIGDKEMTVLEALNMKNNIGLKKAYLSALKRQMVNARNEFDRALNDNKLRIEKIIQDQTAASSVKDPELEKKTVESIESLYKVEFVNVIDLEKKIESLEKEISDFENNVDYALSEANSTTYIEIPD